VVDNGSRDGTAGVVRAFAAAHPHLDVLLVDEEEAGVGRAKNLGAAVATGDVLLFLDADSRLDSTLVAEVGASVIAGFPAGSIRIEADSNHRVDRGFFALMEVGKVWFGVRSQMLYMERPLFQRLSGFRTDFYLAEDLDLLRRAGETVGKKRINHLRAAAIRTSPRRLHRYPFHLAVIAVFVRWVMAFSGYGRRRRY